jgi:hypothetical protein
VKTAMRDFSEFGAHACHLLVIAPVSVRFIARNESYGNLNM